MRKRLLALGAIVAGLVGLSIGVFLAVSYKAAALDAQGIAALEEAEAKPLADRYEDIVDGRWEKPIDLFRRAVTLSPKEARFHHHLGLALWHYSSKEKDEAMNHFLLASQLDPLYTPVQITLKKIEEDKRAAQEERRLQIQAALERRNQEMLVRRISEENDRIELQRRLEREEAEARRQRWP